MVLPAVQIQGSATPGQSSGDAMLMMEQLASKLPSGIGYEVDGYVIPRTSIR